MSETNKAIVRRLVDEAQSNSNFDVVDEILADDFIDHTPFPGVPPTRLGVRMLFGGLRAAFPDLHVTIDEQVAEGNKVVTRKTFRGTHRGDFMGAPPTNRPIAWEVIDILTLRDGRIVEHRMVTDRLSLQQQLAG